ncbi:MAG TPA: pyrroloquinoline quinone-dependent dehydrogenase, partial [Chthonomonadales bacterium]|nr:pyrroloquinoline quinone-dependent dehydrogenase [Chthonomonadales bacterium]
RPMNNRIPGASIHTTPTRLFLALAALGCAWPGAPTRPGPQRVYFPQANTPLSLQPWLMRLARAENLQKHAPGVTEHLITSPEPENCDWPVVGGDAGGARWSPLTQIDRANVGRLKVAWIYHTGDAPESTPDTSRGATPGGNPTIECTPVVVDGVAYITTVKVDVAALDAATGRQIWRTRIGGGGVNRGVAYWRDTAPTGSARIFIATTDSRLISLDARTGLPDPDFGANGTVNLRAGITERDISGMVYGVTSAPAVYKDLVIVSFLVSEAMPGAPGDIRAFDARTGKEVWRFHTVPWPGEYAHDTWPRESWKDRTGVNAWSGFTLDPQRGILFCGTGSASSDFYGADRPGPNLFANCTLALDAATGKRLWHFQEVHHDLWDHDNPCPPVLVQLNRGGKIIDAVAQPTKTGFIYLFDRVTGKPLFRVKELPAPPSDIPGEHAWATQPEPVKPPPIARQTLTDKDVTDISPGSHEYVMNQLKQLRYGRRFLPPSLQGSVILPGFHGGATWSGACFDPTNGLLYINSNNTPYISRLIPDGNGRYRFGGYTYLLDQDGLPGVKPPWGELFAVNVSNGTFTWRVPFGEYPDLAARGMKQTGTQSFGGAIVTAGGLVFIGATLDEKFHAFDKSTGKLLWQFKLPHGGYATPCTYMLNGRQYVLIACGGGGKLGTKSGDEFVAFALGS